MHFRQSGQALSQINIQKSRLGLQKRPSYAFEKYGHFGAGMHTRKAYQVVQSLLAAMNPAFFRPTT